MKKIYKLLPLLICILFLIACSKTAPKATTESSRSSIELADTTVLVDGNEEDLPAAKSIEDYVLLTSDYSLEEFDQAEADKRLAEVKSLKYQGELAPDEETMFDTLVQSASVYPDTKSKLIQLGIQRDKEAAADPDGTYDATYNVAITLEIELDGQIAKSSTMIAMVWTKEGKIQNSVSIADLGEVVDVEEFFNNLAKE